jgi:MFS family permease
VLLHTHPGNQVAFFEIAATLIPLLLFGGVVAERVGPKGDDPQHVLLLGVVIAIIGTYAIITEAFAISVVITGEPTTQAEVLSVTFLFGGMVGVVIAIVYPWYKKLRKAQASWRAGILAGISVLIMVTALVGAGVETMFGLERAGEGEFSEARSAAVTQKTTEEAAVRSRILALWVALRRVEQQAITALVHDDRSAIVDGYQSELFALRAKLTAERKSDKGLAQIIAELRHDEYGSRASG